MVVFVWFCFFWLRRRTRLGVASSVAHRFQSGYDDAFVIVRVELEFCLGVIAVLHQ